MTIPLLNSPIGHLLGWIGIFGLFLDLVGALVLVVSETDGARSHGNRIPVVNRRYETYRERKRQLRAALRELENTEFLQRDDIDDFDEEFETLVAFMRTELDLDRPGFSDRTITGINNRDDVTMVYERSAEDKDRPPNSHSVSVGTLRRTIDSHLEHLEERLYRGFLTLGALLLLAGFTLQIVASIATLGT